MLWRPPLKIIKRIGIAFFFHLYFFGFTQSFRILVTLLYIIGKKVILSKFWDFRLQYLFRCVWCISNIYAAYSLGKFGPKIKNCQFKLKFGT